MTEEQKAAKKEYNRQYRIKNRDKLLQRSREHYHDHKEEDKERKKQRSKEYYIKNKEKILLKCKAWVEANSEKYKARYERGNKTADRKKRNEACSRWLSKNKHKNLEKQRRRELAKAKATPAWITQEHIDEMKSVYAEAKQLENMDGIERHVDHIIPIKGKEVCGLHVPWNLQVLTKEENVKKSNKLLPQHIGEYSGQEV